MAHKLQKDFCYKVLDAFPGYFYNKIILDIGSGDVNGNNNIFFYDCFIIRCDIALGSNVDIIQPAEELKFRDEYFDTIISTECFEHNPKWQETIKNALRMLKSDGLFIFTCATTGRPPHGVLENKPYQSFATKIGINYYKNLTEQDIRKEIEIDKIFSSYEFSTKAQDLYFWGLKK